MLTALGKALRKLRIDQGLLLKDMAEAIGVSSAFLSAVETGRKKVPGNFVDRICDAYNLGFDERFELEEAVEKAQKEVSINLVGVSPESRGLALAFAKRFESLDQMETARLFAILDKRGHE